MSWWWLVSFLLLLSDAVNRNNFKTCDQSGFCKRLRGMEENKSGYYVNPETINQVNSSSVTFTVKHEMEKHAHTVILRVLKDSTIRLTAQEKEPVHPRYSPVDSLGEAPLQDQSCTLSKSGQTATVSFSSHKAVLNYNPLRIDVYAQETLVASVNARGLFHVETQLLKPEVNEEEHQEGEEGENEEDDLGISAEEIAKMDWEESFNSHHDSNPRGPRAISLDVTFTGFDKLYGLPEHADTLALKGTGSTDPYRLYNLDVFEYELDNPMALYGAIPYVHALSPKHSVGMMWLNAAETWVDINYSNEKSIVGRVLSSIMSSDEVSRIDTHFMSESGLLDLFLFLGPTPKDVTRQYSNVFGPSYLPPLFAISYHQCRWNYNDQKDVLGVDANFDKYDIPMDVIWLDIEHTDGKRYFSWDARKFPDSKEMLSTLAGKGRNMVTIIDPHIKVDKNWGLYKAGKDHSTCGIYVQNKDGGNFEGHCWPGTSSWIDYTSPCARQWWAEQFSYDNYQGSSPSLFTWNDMNEPSVFNGPEVSMPKDNLHAEQWEHRDVHNIYGHYMHKASSDGQVLRSQNTARPFVLSRAFFVGSHRIGPIWTGDNYASWEHLKMSIPMLLSLNVAGYTFVGADVGGFFGSPATELLVRWYQVGVLQPFLRAHAHIDTRRREPWLFGEENTALIRDALILRYQLLPYIYTQFYKASVDNSPIMRPLWYDHPSDTSLYSNQEEFLLGDSLLSSPVLESNEKSHLVTLPGPQVWYDYHSYTKYSPGTMHISVKLSSTPLFIKGGSILLTKMRVRRSSQLMESDPYTIIVALDNKGEAKGEAYVDDGKSFDYKNNKFSFQNLSFTGNKLSCRSGVKEAHYKSAGVERVVILGVDNSLSASHNGSPIISTFSKSSHSITLKKPNLVLSDEWDIEFS
ncbi:neutral alpha-glucosidase AB-like isoform X2 [Bolinopsis microptera]|uniref:neutral alpha-glucosidase AB-like isoform X2 n=1 Tax=Bolinopsis microptera TaxID=2820187 RepID=UPI00307B02C1